MCLNLYSYISFDQVYLFSYVIAISCVLLPCWFFRNRQFYLMIKYFKYRSIYQYISRYLSIPPFANMMCVLILFLLLDQNGPMYLLEGELLGHISALKYPHVNSKIKSFLNYAKISDPIHQLINPMSYIHKEEIPLGFTKYSCASMIDHPYTVSSDYEM